MSVYRFKAIRAAQAPEHDVFTFAATPEQIWGFAEIERVGREDNGNLRGFQRHQIASHIKEIRDYLRRDDALLPNALIVAFIGGVKVKDRGDGVVDVEIKASDVKPGFVVDGQQRLSALSGVAKPGFQVFVSALVCKDYNELRQQFVLVNNTRPLPKTLIYELLPTVEGLPERFTARKFAARIVDRLNFTRGSSLRGEIRQHTNPKGVLSDTAMQKLVMNSASDGAIREFIKDGDFENRAYDFVNAFFGAVESVFGSEWIGMSPKTSRLRHGAGIVAMGFVMEFLYSSEGATTRPEFERSLELLKKYTAWTSGQWRLAPDDERPWNGIQNTPSDIDLLTNYLVRSMKRALRQPRQVANS
ncbi:DGQHR domain protein [Burkholderia sp. lig30]|uniref:DGQHR domain-containing protein n=1 Tax=Paraburkholderia unamae TaxID=219649 RepID=A0ABX5KVH9_9BURK|nr:MULTISPECIES: DGQHR domain-containing protein DpdB [Burkholderiaceae]KDB08040.1 DGQHR domain protein [Burkholderia sp. lig30]PVX97680.1 DGQHR domain-containing protein [Paraburkholderia unamae]